jgi:glycerol-3-phosphate dehydrogenase (NAD+)
MSVKVCIVGSGNWGSAIARILGETVKRHASCFAEKVKMWVFEEEFEGRKLSEIINTDHENTKYLPGKKLPANIVAVPDLVESAGDADVLVFVVPHQFTGRICEQLKGHLKPEAFGVTLIKGLATTEQGGIKLISEQIADMLDIPMTTLMGANLAREIAEEQFSEATVGASRDDHAQLLKKLFQTDYFRITCVKDAHTVELCGALKNVVACGAGFTDGLGLGDNTKSAVIRIGLMEMTKFVEFFYPGSNLATFFESCGIADLITTCYGGRNRLCAEAFVKTGKSLQQLEAELLKGQRLQGPHTAEQVNKMLIAHNMRDKFPLFDAVHQICAGTMKPQQFIDCLRDHPEHR